MAIAFIGLGNPGASHVGNRHNIGFMAVDALASAVRAADFKKKFSGLLAEASVSGEKLYLFKPQSYMNRSGVPTSELIQFYKIPVENVIVFYDELDLPLGKLRIKQGGGSGGHNGIKSLDQHLGADYWRVRIGIDHPGMKEMVTSHVLSDFSKDEYAQVEMLLKTLAKQAEKFVGKDMNAVTNNMALESPKK